MSLLVGQVLGTLEARVIVAVFAAHSLSVIMVGEMSELGETSFFDLVAHVASPAVLTLVLSEDAIMLIEIASVSENDILRGLGKVPLLGSLLDLQRTPLLVEPHLDLVDEPVDLLDLLLLLVFLLLSESLIAVGDLVEVRAILIESFYLRFRNQEDVLAD